MRASVATTPPARRRIRPFLPRTSLQLPTHTLLSLERGKAAEELKLRVAEASREQALHESLRDRHESHPESLFASELKRARPRRRTRYSPPKTHQ